MDETGKNGKLQTILAQLTKDQLRLVVALQEHPSKDAAAKAINVPVKTVYNWPSDLIDEAARLMALDAVQAALDLRRRNLIKAVGVKAAGLDSRNERIRQNAASEIMEWELGKASQPLDHTTKGEKINPYIGMSKEQLIEIAKGIISGSNPE